MFSRIRSFLNRNQDTPKYVLHVWDAAEGCFGVLRLYGEVLVLDYVEAQIWEDKLILAYGMESRDVRIIELHDFPELNEYLAKN